MFREAFWFLVWNLEMFYFIKQLKRIFSPGKIVFCAYFWHPLKNVIEGRALFFLTVDNRTHSHSNIMCFILISVQDCFKNHNCMHILMINIMLLKIDIHYVLFHNRRCLWNGTILIHLNIDVIPSQDKLVSPYITAHQLS